MNLRLGAAIALASLTVAVPALLAGAPAKPQDPKAAHQAAIDELAKKLADENPDVRARAKRAYRQAAFNASRPDAEAERAAAAQAICQRLEAKPPKPLTLALLDALEHIGRAEAVPVLTALLDPEDGLVRERTRRALSANPSPQAAAALREALDESQDAAWTVGLVNALSRRRDEEAVPALIQLAQSDDAAVRLNAVDALGRIGKAEAIGIVAKTTQQAKDGVAWRRSVVAYLDLADALAAAGETDTAMTMYQSFLEAKGSLKAAGIVGLGRAGGAGQIPALLDALGSGDSEVQSAAKAALDLLPVAAVTEALTEKAKTASPEMKALLLSVLAERGDASVLPAFLAAAKDVSAEVRLAAYQGMGQLADDGAVPVLLAALAKESGPQLKAAKSALGSIHTPQANQALIDAVGKGDPKARAAAIELLADRRATAAVPALLEAAKDEDSSIRRAAFKALGQLASVEQLPTLVQRLVGADSGTDRQAAQKALAAAVKRIEEPDACAKPIVAALEKVPAPAKAALLRVLGDVPSDDALAALRSARKADHPDIQDAAVRALAEWPTAAVLDELLDIARTADKQVHRVIALRGYVRAAGLVEGKSPEEVVALYKKAMDAAQRPEDKRMVLAGAAAVPSLGALQMVGNALEDSELKQEATVATVKIAETLHGIYRTECLAALAKAAAVEDPDLAKEAHALINRINALGAYVTAWQVSGPYTAEGDLMKTAFPPEKKGESAEWTIMPPSPYPAIDESWVWSLNIDEFFGGKDNFAVYLRTQLFSPKKQPAVIELGSDDTCKLWVGGTLVHTATEPRSLKPGEDTVKVALEKGWTPVLLKVVEKSGDAGAALRIVAPKGGKLDGIRANPFGK